MPKSLFNRSEHEHRNPLYISFITTLICFRNSVRCFTLGHVVKETPARCIYMGYADSGKAVQRRDTFIKAVKVNCWSKSVQTVWFQLWCIPFEWL